MDEEIDLHGLSDLQAGLIRADFGLWCEMALEPFGHRPAAHHRLIIRELQDLSDGVHEQSRLLIEMPPGSAKSTYASVLFPPWEMARRWKPSVIGASSTSKLAEDFSRKVQQHIRELSGFLGYGLRTEAAERWQTDEGGTYLAVGIGGTAAGFRADLALIDDPFKSREDADSETMREKAWSWYQSVLEPRMRPKGKIVLITTRWHEDDLAGRLLDAEPAQWRQLCIKAQAEAGDPLGRAPGQFLWGDDAYGYAALLQSAKERLERAGATREWSSLYQQEPRPTEGLLFKVDNIPAPIGLPPAGRAVRAWDLAATEDAGGRDPDWTAGVKLVEPATGGVVVADVERFRGGPQDVVARIRSVAVADGHAVQISLPQDPGAGGKAWAAQLVQILAGYDVIVTPETGSKQTRAAAIAAQCNVGNMRICAGAWNRPFREELRGFPAGSKDDQVDALSRAYTHLLTAPPAAKAGFVDLMGR